MDILKGLDKAICEVLGQEEDYNLFESFVPTVSALDLNKGYLESITTSGSYLMTNIYDSITFKIQTENYHMVPCCLLSRVYH